MTIGEAAAAMGGRAVFGSSDARREITSVTSDSREARPGSLFLCFRGERADGHSFAADAFARGAVCAVAEREPDGAPGPYILVGSTAAALGRLGAFHRSRLKIPVIGVVGSVGKTTAKEMTAAVLSERYDVLKTQGNLNNELGVPLTLLQAGAEHGAAVVEMGISDFGEMTRLAGMARPGICVVTAIAPCHLEKLGDLRGVLRAKAEIFPLMPENGAAVVNGDDGLLMAYDTGVEKITFGLGERCGWRAGNIVADGTRNVSFDLISPWGERVRAAIPAYGEHLVYAALAAAAVGARLGQSLEEIARGLEKYRPAAGRADVFEAGGFTVIDDCYNANPSSAAAALRSLVALGARRVAILGDMRELGRASKEAHREIGALAGALGIDCLICHGEMSEFTFKGFISSGSGKEAYFFPFREALFGKLPELIRGGDAVLVKASHGERFDEIVGRLRGLRARPGAVSQP
jgi:UDP-N-acetylmuramoyl-tripeptide--D-alanyl-D-alanine ligase